MPCVQAVRSPFAFAAILHLCYHSASVEEPFFQRPSEKGIRLMAVDRQRWVLTFSVIALLTLLFGLVAFWGLSQSNWLYGTYGQITPGQWDRIQTLRDRLAERQADEQVLNLLDDALLVPRPATQDVLYNLERAAASLKPNGDPLLRSIQLELYGLLSEIQPGYVSSSPTPWSTPTAYPTPLPTPFEDPPVA
jgi:hypothetical protein